MSMSDPIADLLTRIRNAQMVAKPTVSVPSSKVKIAIAQVLKDEGYIDGFQVKTEAGKSELEIALKYYAGRPVIERIERVSRPGLRVYKASAAIPQVQNGLGVAIVTTPQGRDDRPQGARYRCRWRSAVLRRLTEEEELEMSRVGKMPVAIPARRGCVDQGRPDQRQGHGRHAAAGPERAGQGRQQGRQAELRARQRFA